MSNDRVDDLKADTLPELLRQLANETTTLVRQEIALAKVELTQTVKTFAAGTGMFGGAVVLGLGAFGALTTFIIVAIALLVPLWAAALVVTIVYAVAAYVLLELGKKTLMHVEPVPQQTAQSLKEDVEWVKTRTQSSKR